MNIYCKNCKQVIGKYIKTNKTVNGYKLVEEKLTNAEYKDIIVFPKAKGKYKYQKSLICDFCNKQAN